MTDILSIKNGRHDAFVEVYHAFHTRLYHYFLKKCRSEDTAKELIQLSFIKLWQSRHTLSEHISFDAQLFTIANSVLIDFLRKEAPYRATAGEDQLPDELAEMTPAHREFESLDFFHAAARHMPPVRKKVFELKIVYGYSNREIANNLSISLKTVEDHITKGLRFLKSLLTTVILLLLFCGR